MTNTLLARVERLSPNWKIALMGSATALGASLLGGFIAIAPQVIKPAYATCAHPDFGQIGWEYTDTAIGSSGWGNGPGQIAQCERVMDQFISSRIPDGVKYVHGEPRPKEQGKWGAWRKREYQYSCEIDFQWGPIYAEEQGEVCGRKI